MNRLMYCGPVTIEVLCGSKYQVTARIFRTCESRYSNKARDYIAKDVVIQTDTPLFNRVDHQSLLEEIKYRIARHLMISPLVMHIANVKFHKVPLTVDARKPLKRDITFDRCDLYIQGLRNGPYGASDFGFRHTIIRDCTLKGLLVHPDGSAHDMSSLHLRFFARYNPHKLRLEGTNG